MGSFQYWRTGPESPLGRAGSVADINFIRINSGGLPGYSGPVTAAALLDELLYNKRYSLL